MELGPFIFFIIYIVFQVLTAQNKAKRKRERQQQEQYDIPEYTPPVRPNQPVEPAPAQEQPKGGFFEEFMRQLEELENPKPVENPYPTAAPVTMENIPPPAKSSEITVAEYSNLEQGIIDETHRSKFPHHKLTAHLPQKKQVKPIQLFKNVDAREAFVYSLIFERKEY